MNTTFKKLQALLLTLILTLTLTGCLPDIKANPTAQQTTTATSTTVADKQSSPDGQPAADGTDKPTTDGTDSQESNATTDDSIIRIPAYSDAPYIVIHNNVPYFTAQDLTTESYEYYSALDKKMRCGMAISSIGKDLMPTEARGSIGSVKPTGWQTAKYDIVDGKYLYNRCHLIGFQLTGENANKRNLITGTRYLNVTGMLPFENMTADYIKETGNHVLYRVTPVFAGDNLVAQGVLMEAQSVEDGGEGIQFNVFCYNVQPGIAIDYADGDSALGTPATSAMEIPVEILQKR